MHIIIIYYEYAGVVCVCVCLRSRLDDKTFGRNVYWSNKTKKKNK